MNHNGKDAISAALPDGYDYGEVWKAPWRKREVMTKARAEPGGASVTGLDTYSLRIFDLHESSIFSDLRSLAIFDGL